MLKYALLERYTQTLNDTNHDFLDDYFMAVGEAAAAGVDGAAPTGAAKADAGSAAMAECSCKGGAEAAMHTSTAPDDATGTATAAASLGRRTSLGYEHPGMSSPDIGHHHHHEAQHGEACSDGMRSETEPEAKGETRSLTDMQAAAAVPGDVSVRCRGVAEQLAGQMCGLIQELWLWMELHTDDDPAVRPGSTGAKRLIGRSDI